ncbi:hypothetical protein DSECCO2_319810 [anaerobic digester metagenome]
MRKKIAHPKPLCKLIYLLHPMNTKILLLLIATLSCTPLLNAQEEKHSGHDGHAHHHDYRHEIGLVNSIAWFPGEDEQAYSLHLHYMYSLGNGRFGIGAGYERIFDEHGHHWLGLAGSYRPLRHFSIILAPGMAIEDEHPYELRFATHLEVLYEFPLGPLHIGPVLSAGIDTQHHHFGAGLHIAIGF